MPVYSLLIELSYGVRNLSKDHEAQHTIACFISGKQWRFKWNTLHIMFKVYLWRWPWLPQRFSIVVTVVFWNWLDCARIIWWFLYVASKARLIKYFSASKYFLAKKRICNLQSIKVNSWFHHNPQWSVGPKEDKRISWIFYFAYPWFRFHLTINGNIG